MGLAEILASCFWLDLILEATASRIGFFCFLFFFLGGGGGKYKGTGTATLARRHLPPPQLPPKSPLARPPGSENLKMALEGFAQALPNQE